mmetsp:Transcript_571/g.1636  ORF Transcript_571/g.1636 Transcript_571/m.1636 type:complete len:200 (+) Transcript_571:320-919(+)
MGTHSICAGPTASPPSPCWPPPIRSFRPTRIDSLGAPSVPSAISSTSLASWCTNTSPTFNPGYAAKRQGCTPTSDQSHQPRRKSSGSGHGLGQLQPSDHACVSPDDVNSSSRPTRAYRSTCVRSTCVRSSVGLAVASVLWAPAPPKQAASESSAKCTSPESKSAGAAARARSEKSLLLLVGKCTQLSWCSWAAATRGST